MGYWEKRQEAMYRAGEMKVNQYFAKLEKAFNQTRRELQKTVESFYWRYAEENGLTYAAAQKRLDRAEIGELKDFIDLVMQNIGKYNQEVNNMSIKARITRYQALETQVDALLRELYAIDYEAMAEQTMQEVYGDAYYRTWYSIDQYHGFHSAFAQVNPLTVNTILEYPFNGANFSSRLWKQKDHLQTVLMESLTTMMVQGVPPQNLAADFAKKMQSKKFEAYRLLHTESSFLMSEATHAGYKEDGVEKYEILTTLDSRTCGVCGEMDGKVYPVEEAVTGKNMPPFHCFCRCTDVPNFDDTDVTDMTRAARDADGNPIEVPADMTWKEWKKKYVDHTEDEADIFKGVKKKLEKLSDHDPVSVFDLKSDYRDEIVDIIEKAPEKVQTFIKKNRDEIVFINESASLGSREGNTGIRVNLKADSMNERGKWCSVFHEIGHRVDRLAGRPSGGDQFESALKSDFENLVRGYQKLYNKNRKVAYKEIGEALKAPVYHSVSDLFGGISNNQCVGSYMHSKPGYWDEPGRLGKEAFAHFFESTIRRDDEKTDILKQSFPEAFKMFEDMLEGLK